MKTFEDVKRLKFLILHNMGWNNNSEFHYLNLEYSQPSSTTGHSGQIFTFCTFFHLWTYLIVQLGSGLS